MGPGARVVDVDVVDVVVVDELVAAVVVVEDVVELDEVSGVAVELVAELLASGSLPPPQAAATSASTMRQAPSRVWAFTAFWLMSY